MYVFTSVDNLFEIEGFYTAINFNWNSSFVFNGESHDFWEAVFVESGRVEVTEDEKAYTLSEDNMIFHAPMEFHRIRSAEGYAPKGLILSFKVTGEPPEAIKSGVFRLDPIQRRIFDELRECVTDFMHKSRSMEMGIKAATLLKLFIMKISETPITIGSSTAHSALEYQRIISFMSENILKNLTLEEISEKINLSVSYMKLLFNTYAGIGPKSYFNLLRVQKATELLGSGKSVNEVSLAMNFSSANYFSVFFKRETGSSPSALSRTKS